uniref:5'-3' exonuclease domain-containing protein n=1 Tax=viral metagenome TaxID=1070528 RepID=A0A6C0J9J7_9ZZZZ
MSKNFLLIDGSYFVFYRYYAISSWFKLAKKEQIIDKENPPIENIEFVEKFIKTFVSKLDEIKDKLKLDNPVIIVGKDCPRQNIWRMEHLSSYKANRVYDDSFLGGPFFKMAYNDDLFIKGGANKILKYPGLEADDCLAIITEKIKTTFPHGKITIITSDMDYLQLACENVELYDLKYIKLTDRKSSYNNAEKDLFVKILTGDKSDNIEGVFKKCGPKTACKYFDNKELFEEKLKSVEGAMERFELNKKIIDFNEIPEDLVKNFLEKYNI